MTDRNTAPAPLERQLSELVSRCDWLMQALGATRELGLASWCIGAGAVRNVVWDSLHERTPTEPTDIDVTYFDTGRSDDAALEKALHDRLPGLPWEVTNQATVHHWFDTWFGRRVAPFRSLEDGIASWPEYATCVGVWLDDEDTVQVIAPHGLDDLFGQVVRHNPTRASTADYGNRLAAKQFAQRWPQLTVMPG